MAFKNAVQFNEVKYKGKFILQDDNDYADVVFLYTKYEEVLFVDAHYIKSADYNGYVQCLGRNCPVCAKGIKVYSNKLFIPVYNITTDEFEFWDRSSFFEKQLYRDVFKKYPDPSNIAFRVTRHGQANDRETKYSIDVLSKSPIPYEEILKKFEIKFPDAYEQLCREFSAEQLTSMLTVQAQKSIEDDLPDYSITPRGTNTAATPVYDPVSADADLDDIQSESSDGDLGEVDF